MAALLTVLSISILLFLSTLTTTNGKRLVAKLIHYNSVSSPYYKPNETINNRAKRTIQSSISRFAYLSEISALASNQVYQTDLVPSTVVPQFFVSFSIGQPPIPQLAVMDTGSSILWVKCLPCTPCPRQNPFFDPSKSSTYSILSCHSYPCGKHNCNSLNQCSYNISYVQGPSSFGLLSTELLTLENDVGEVVVSNVVFGCGHVNGNFLDRNVNGVFGLGNGRYKSIVEQLGHKFSYCTGNLKDPDYDYNRLILGDEAILTGSSTPLANINGRYYITLEGISIGSTRLNIDPIIFRKVRGIDNGVMIDSGTGLTFIARSAYELLSKWIQQWFEGFLTRYDIPPLPLCYEGNIEEDLHEFPLVVFHFADGADLVLDIRSSFIQVHPNVLCSSFVPSDIIKRNHENLTIIGMWAQQKYNVGYDLGSMKLYFDRIDCELFEED